MLEPNIRYVFEKFGSKFKFACCNKKLVVKNLHTKEFVTTYNHKGKLVGKSITKGNIKKYYQRGKPVGKAIRR